MESFELMEQEAKEFILYEASKMTLCILLTQQGKTFTTINRISTEIKQDDEFGRSIHIVFTMNTLLNNKQFAKRLESIENIYGKGSICVFSSVYNGKYIHVKDRLQLQGICADESTCPRVIVMCSNHQRYDDGVEFLKVINKNKINIYRAFAYYDELHKYITPSLRLQIEDIHKLDIVKGIIALSATPDPIFKCDGFWSKLRLIELDHFNASNYVGYKDMIFNCIDNFFTEPYIRPKPFDFNELDKHTIGFISYVLDKYPEIIKNNTRTFIPAHVRRSGHNMVRDLIFKINKYAVVIVINGFEKTLQYKDHMLNTKTIPLSSEDEEVCETISKLIMNYELQTRPIVITGFLCVGMGQTLTHRLLGSFTSAIFSHLDLTNDEIYQLIGRITGRMKDWGDKYVQTEVYCPTTIMHRFHVMEECARNIACEHNGDIVTQNDYREPMNKMGDVGMSAIKNIRKEKQKIEKREKKLPEFDGGIEFFKHCNGFELSDKYIKDVMKGITISQEKLKTSYYFGKGSRKENGFIKCALFGKQSQIHTLEELLETKPWIEKNNIACFGRTIEDARNTGWAIHLYYGYENKEDINSLWYGVRWIRKINKIENTRYLDMNDEKQDTSSDVCAQPSTSSSSQYIYSNMAHDELKNLFKERKIKRFSTKKNDK